MVPESVEGITALRQAQRPKKINGSFAFCLLPLVYNYELCIMNYEFSFILSLYIVEFIMQFDGIIFNLNLFQKESTD